MIEANENEVINKKPRRRVVLLTGLSGAGISTSLKTLEDIGYEAVDNLRIGLIPSLLADRGEEDKKQTSPLAVAIDTRNANFKAESLLNMVAELKTLEELEVTLVFLEADNNVIQKRFSTTRRRHPMTENLLLGEGIEKEVRLLKDVKEAADEVLDTSLFSIHDLRRWIRGVFNIENRQNLSIFVISFGFRYGIPREADMVFDMRFLRNPHWDPALRDKTGKDAEVGAYIEEDEACAPFLENLTTLLKPLVPKYLHEGKSYLTIAIGCFGGRHRSVYIAEQLTNILAGQGYIVGLAHREQDEKDTAHYQ